MQYKNLMQLGIILFLGIFFTTKNAASQTVFQKRYQSASAQEVGLTVVPASNGSIIVAGHSNYDDILVYKTNTSGDLSWSNTYGGNDEDIAFKVRTISDGGYIIVGSTKSYGAGEKDVILMKLNASGNVSWTQTFGTIKDDIGYDVIQTNDGGYIITGSAYYSNNVTEGRILLIKTNASGQETWSKMYGESMGNEGRHIMLDTDGGYLIFGTASNGFVLIIKTSSDGTAQWSTNFLPIGYGGPDLSQVIKTNDNGFAFVGTITKNSDLKQKAFFIKTDASGTVQFTKIYGTNFQNKGLGIAATSYGYLIAGHSDSFSPNFWNIFYTRVDNSGNILGTEFIENLNYRGFNLQRSPDNMIVGCGGVSNSGSYLVKSDENGYTSCTNLSATLNTDSPSSLPGSPSWTTSGTLTSAAQTLSHTNVSLTTSTICLGTGIDETDVSNLIKIYPNPATDILWIDGTELHIKKNSEVQLYNSLGKKVLTGKLNNSDRNYLNIKSLTKGIYLLKIQNSDHSFTQKLIIQ